MSEEKIIYLKRKEKNSDDCPKQCIFIQYSGEIPSCFYYKAKGFLPECNLKYFYVKTNKEDADTRLTIKARESEIVAEINALKRHYKTRKAFLENRLKHWREL